LDHYITAQAYTSLSSLLTLVKTDNVALTHANRALYLNLILGDINNLSVVDTVSHIGKILQEMGEPKHARQYIQKALDLTDTVYGTVNIHSADLCHLLAISWISEDIKESFKYETRNLEICRRLLGDKDFRTMEANIWLGQILKNTAQFMNTKKKQQHLKSKREAKQGTDISQEINHDIASRSVNDVLKFIEGKSTGKSPRPNNKASSQVPKEDKTQNSNNPSTPISQNTNSAVNTNEEPKTSPTTEESKDNNNPGDLPQEAGTHPPQKQQPPQSNTKPPQKPNPPRGKQKPNQRHQKK